MGPTIGEASLAGQSWLARGGVWPAGWLDHPVGKSVGVCFSSKISKF